MRAGAHTITPFQSHRLLGTTVSQSLRWDDHIVKEDKSLISQLRSRLNGLSLISKYASYQTRLMVGQGIFMSKLCYLIQIWGGTSGQMIKTCQVMQNKAMRLITGMHWFTPTGVLLRKCNWLSVRQLIEYHSILTIHKIVMNQAPTYLYHKIHPEDTHNTRHPVKFGENFKGKTERTQMSFCYRGVISYNKVPIKITREANVFTFKNKLKSWIEMNTPRE